MNPYSILMFLFSGALLLYAGLLRLTRSLALIPRSQDAQIADKRAYVSSVAAMVAVTALAPLGSGIYALISMQLGAIAFVVDLPLCLYIGYRLYGSNSK